MADCKSCTGGCSGCDKSLTLTRGELELLQVLGQIPFLPIARTKEDPTPYYPEGTAYSSEEYALILQLLEKKGLVSLDFDKPLKNHTPSPAYPIHGSMALTARGQQVLEILELQGVTED